MRELKFRAWNKTWKMMSPVDKIEFENGRPSSVSVTIKATDFDHTGEWEDCEVGKEVILQQNTGLTDKNGKEVYEGDVVKFNDECGEWINKVVFERGLFGLGLSPKQIKNPTDWKEKHNKVESRWWSVEWGYEEFGTAFSYRKPLAQRTVYRGNISEYRESDDHKNQEKIGFEKYFIRNCEVIGNIFANPELLGNN